VIVRELAQAPGIGNVDLLPTQLYQPAISKAAEQPADYFAHAAEFVGQRLMCGVQGWSAGEQQRREPLIQLVNGDGFDQQHQIGQSRAEQFEDVAAERFMPRQQLFEQRQRHGNQCDRRFGDAGRGVVDMAEQATAGEHAALAGRDAIKQDFPALIADF